MDDPPPTDTIPLPQEVQHLSSGQLQDFLDGLHGIIGGLYPVPNISNWSQDQIWTWIVNHVFFTTHPHHMIAVVGLAQMQQVAGGRSRRRRSNKKHSKKKRSKKKRSKKKRSKKRRSRKY